MRNRIRYFLSVVVLLALANFAFGQAETGTISGTVTDSTGAVIGGATITAQNVGTGLTRTTKSTANGSYTILNVPPATYTVTVENPAFETLKQTVDVTVGGRATVDASLKVGTTGTVIEVTAEAANAQVNTQDQQISNTVTAAQISELPSLTRNPYDFVQISGYANATPNITNDRGVGYSINGQRAASQILRVTRILHAIRSGPWPGCAVRFCAGIQSDHQHVLRAVWPRIWRHRESRDEGGYQRISRHDLRI